MQLREIHIDGFGATFDRHLTGLAPGVNVLYGPNEHGKTTLLEFVRRTLFGYKASIKDNDYATQGSAFGGRLILDTERGLATVARAKGTRKEGAVTVTLGESVLSGQEAVDQLLGRASRDLFQNVFAFTLDELQGFDKGDEVTSRIYGAGMGLNHVSLAKVTQTLKKDQEALFKKAGSNPALNKMKGDADELREEIQALKNNLPEYDRCCRERDQLKAECARLEEAEEQEGNHLREIELRLELYPAYLKMEEAQAELNGLGVQVSFPENTYDDFKRVKAEIEEKERQIKEETDSHSRLLGQLDSLKTSKDFLNQEGQVESLRQSIEQVKSALKDRSTCSIERDRFDNQIEADVHSMGVDWDEERVVQFVLTEPELAEVGQFDLSLNELGQKVRDARAKLDIHREQKATTASSRKRIPEWLNGFVYTFGAIGFALVVVSLILSDWAMTAGGVVVLAASTMLFFTLRRKEDDFESEDFEGVKREEDLAEANRVENDKFEEWWAWLKARGLEKMGPRDVERVWTRVGAIKGEIRKRDELLHRVAEMQTMVDEAEQRVQSISAIHPALSLGNDLSANLALVCQAWEKERSREEKRLRVEENVREQERRIARLDEEIQARVESRQALFLEIEATDERQFIALHQQAEHQKKLKVEMGEVKLSIQERVGTGSDYASFVESLRQARPSDLENEIEIVKASLANIREVCQSKREAIGKLKGEAERLVSEDSLLDRQTKLESLKTEMNRLARKWAVMEIANTLLDRAKRHYEETRQPSVIQAAGQRFRFMTAGRYEKIIKPLESDDLMIEDQEGRLKGVMAMSRGTREQLYLALRLGLIEEYETRAEPLPVMMDDVYVNFDDDRKQRMLELLEDFSKGRQVILLTCHRQTRDLCRDSGAHVIEW